MNCNYTFKTRESLIFDSISAIGSITTCFISGSATGSGFSSKSVTEILSSKSSPSFIFGCLITSSSSESSESEPLSSSKTTDFDDCGGTTSSSTG